MQRVVRSLLVAMAVAGPFAAAEEGAPFAEARLTQEERELVIRRADGTVAPTPRLRDQVGYAQPRVAPDGRFVGWLAMFPNCCTSYPIALHVVVLDRDHSMHTFEGVGLAIFRWCFSTPQGSIAFRQGVLHGTNAEHFELRRIADGKQLATFDIPHEDWPGTPPPLPAWARCTEPATN